MSSAYLPHLPLCRSSGAVSHAGECPRVGRTAASWALIVALACLWSALAIMPAAAQSGPITPATPCTPIRNLTNLPGIGARGITNQPVLSSNGARVAFWSSNDLQPGRNLDGNLEIFVQDTAGLDKVQLTDSLGSILGGFNLAPSINQAGTQVAFYSDRDLLKNGRNRDGNFEIFLASLSGGQWQITQITDTRGSANLFPSISADGTRIAFVSDDAELHNLDAARSNPDRNFEIMLATVSGGQVSFRQVTDTPLGTTNDTPSISDSGARIAFASGSGQNVQVFVWDTAGGAPIRLTEAGINEQPTINADGTRIAYISTPPGGSNRVVLHSLLANGESQASVIVPSATDASYRNPSISDNGERVAYVAETTVGTDRRVEVNLYDSTTGRWVPIATLGQGTSEQPSISGDGTRVAFVGVSNVSDNPDDTGSEIYLTDCPVADLGLSFVSPPPATVLAGVDLVYTLRIVNRGPSLAPNARVVYDLGLLPGLPQNVSFAPDLSDCTLGGNVVTCNLGDMAAGETRTVRVGWDVPSNAQLAPIVSRFTAQANAVDPRPADNDTGQVSTTVSEVAAVSLTKAADISTIVAGTHQVLTYRLTVRNAGPSNARQVVVTDNLPPHVDLLPNPVITGGGSGASCSETVPDRQVVCNLGTVAANTSATIDIAVRALASAPASLTNVASVTSPTDDPSGSDNQATVVTSVDRPADMVIAKSAALSTVVAGTPLTYTLVITNLGPANTENVVVTDLLPANVTFRSQPSNSTDCSADASLKIVTCTLEGMNAGTSRTVSFATMVSSTAPAGAITNQATVNSARQDPNAANNTSPAVTTQVILRADLAVDKLVSKAEPNVGETIIYTVTVTNNGPSQATNVQVHEPLPEHVDFVGAEPSGSYSDVTGIWNVGTLPVGESRTLPLVAKPETVLGGLTVTNTATITNLAQIDPDLTDNSDEVSIVPQRADLHITKNASPDPVMAGERLTYTVVVSNAGPTKALTVMVTDQLPAGAFVVNSGGCPRVGNEITCNEGELAPGESRTRTFVITFTVATDITNVASVSSPTPDDVPGNNLSSVTVEVNPALPDHLTFETQPDNSIRAGDLLSPQPVVAIRDRFGNIVNEGPGAGDTVQLDAYLGANCAVAGGGSLSNGSTAASAGIATFGGVTYTKSETIYLRASIPSRPNVTAACSTAIVVSPGEASKLGFVTPPREIIAGNVSPAMTVQRQDAFGNANPAVTPITLTLDITNTSGEFLALDGVTPIANVVIPQGAAEASFRYSDTVAGAYTVTVDDGPSGLIAATQVITVEAAEARDLLLLFPPSTPITAGISSDVFRLERRDAFGNPNTEDPDVTVVLTSTSTGSYAFRNPANLATVTEVVIEEGTYSTTFRYRDTLAGGHTIWATDAEEALTPALVGITVVPAPASRIVFVEGDDQTITAGTAGSVMTVERRDEFDNLNTSDAPLTVLLTSTSTGAYEFRSTPAGTPLPGDIIVINTGAYSASFYYYDTKATATGLSHTITASDEQEELTPDTLTVKVEPAEVTQVVFTTPPRTVVAGTTSDPIRVQRQDEFGNPNAVEPSLVLTLTSTSTTTQPFRADNGSTVITTVTILEGNASASFRYTDTVAGTYVITADDELPGSPAPASQPLTVTAAPASALVILSDTINLTAGERSGEIIVERRDPFGNANSTDITTTVKLDSTSLVTVSAFYSSASAMAQPVTSVQIGQGISQTSFVYQDGLAGAHTITVDDQQPGALGLDPDSVPVTVGAGPASKLVFINPARTITAGTLSLTLTVQLQDTFNNVVTRPAGAPLTVELATMSLGSGAFKRITDTTTINSVVIPGGASLASFRYTDEKAGGWQMIATAPAIGLTGAGKQAEQTITVNAAEATKLVFVTAAQTISAGIPSAVMTIQRQDQFDNPNRSDDPVIVMFASDSLGFSAFVSDTSPITITSRQAVIGTGHDSVSFRYYDEKKGTPTITVTDTAGLLTGESQQQTVRGGVPNRLALSGSATQTAGVSQSVTITAFDAFNNPSDAFTGVISITFGGADPAPNGTAPTMRGSDSALYRFGEETPVNFAAGVATALMTLYRAGPAVITATVTGGVETAPGDGLNVTVGPADAAFIRAETAPDGNGSLVITQTVASSSTVQAHAIARDTYLNFVVNEPATTWSLADVSGGVLAADLSASSGEAVTFTARKVGTARIVPAFGTLTSVPSGLLTVMPGAPTKVRVESAPNGAGGVIAEQSIQAGTMITAYATSRDFHDNFVANPAATWAMVNTTGGVSNSNLSHSGPSQPISRTVFTAGLVGSGQIEAAFSGLAKTPSGVITVQPGPATQLRITGPVNVQAGVPNQINITALDVAGNTAVSYAGDKNLVFSGASPSTRTVAAPTVTNKLSAPIHFGQNTVLTFTAGRMMTGTTGLMTLYRAGSTTINVTDGSISSSGGSLAVNVQPAPLNKLSIYKKGDEGLPPVLTVVTAGVPVDLVIRAEDQYGNVRTDYTGNKTLVFSGAPGSLIAPNGREPTVEPKSGSSQEFGKNTQLDFVAGVATANTGKNGVMTLYRTGGFEISATDGSLSTGANGKLSVQVRPNPDQHFVWQVTSPQTNGQVFTGNNTLTVQDQFSNTVAGFNAAERPVAILPVDPLTGTITIGGSGGDHILNEADDFVNGVADLEVLQLRYTGTAGTGRFSATSPGMLVAVSGNVTIQPGTPQTLIIQGKTTTAGTPQSNLNIQAGTPISLSLALYDVSNNLATSFNDLVGLTFSGAPPDSVVRNNAGAPVQFGNVTNIQFTGGQADVSDSANGLMLLFRATSGTPYDITATATGPVVATRSNGHLSVTVTPGPLAAFHLDLTSPQTNTMPFSGRNVLTATDQYENVVVSFNPAANPVTFTVTSQPTATIAFSGSGGDNVLDESDDFTNGIADLTVLGMTYTGLDNNLAGVTLVAQGQSGHQASQTVIIRPSEATRLQLTGFPGSQQAGNPFLLNIQAYDTSGNEAIGYTGNKLLTFGGASVSDNGDAPYVDSVAQPFGASTAVTFDSAGHATVGATLFAAETAAITVTDSLISSNAFALLVLPGPFVQFDLRLATPQQAGVAFSGTNVLRAEDLYGNPTDYDAFSDPVTIAPLAPAGGDVAGLGGPNGDQLNQSSDFVDGVANLTGRLLYSGTVGGAIFEASSFFASDNSELVQIDAGPPYTITIEDPNPGLQPQVAQRKEYRVQLYDILGNPAVAGDNRTVMLSVTGVDPVGAFYDGPGPEASIISNVAINSGAGSATFFYQPATSGSQELSGNDGVTPQIAPLTINVP